MSVASILNSNGLISGAWLDGTFPNNVEFQGDVQVDGALITNNIEPIAPGQIVNVAGAVVATGYLSVSDYLPGTALRIQGNVGGPGGNPAIYQDIAAAGSLTLASNNTKASNLVVNDTEITTSVPLFSKLPTSLQSTGPIVPSAGGLLEIDFTGQPAGIYDVVAFGGAGFTLPVYPTSCPVYWDGTTASGGTLSVFSYAQPNAGVGDYTNVLSALVVLTTDFSQTASVSKVRYTVLDTSSPLGPTPFKIDAWRRSGSA